MNERIQKFAKFFRAIFLVALIASPLIVGSIWLTGGEIMLMDDDSPSMAIEFLTEDLGIDEAQAPAYPLAWSTRILGLGVDMLPTAIGMLSLWWLVQLFSCFAAGEIFTRNTVMYIRRTGWTMLIGVCVGPIHEALLTLVLTINNPPGERMISISLDSANFEEVVIAGVIILVSWIMEEGRKLREVNELTV
ncbi:hypothetical protein SYK_31990 [Pseudodesulfovibrio nedwellii]|uniref:DUF2975 domain-containing protein n=1 Tax=Pseudodesulfovibrio nedwellii TaxID=2973072 RepID=A0ABN6S6D1_9BACT|nr:DUF2975 domain-containing protein [Pseudodesulfovibrio nedwellii]BDQ38839.1 hypothetical protein SYK_31990 [Pseudodesulfovibrio nedwellii]